jgi:acetylglutamate kinase
MIPKLDNAYEAISAGVKQVIITRADAISAGNGTKVI